MWSQHFFAFCFKKNGIRNSYERPHDVPFNIFASRIKWQQLFPYIIKNDLHNSNAAVFLIPTARYGFFTNFSWYLQNWPKD